MLVYFPAAAGPRSVRIDDARVTAELQITWVDIDRGQIAESVLFHDRTVAPPEAGNYVAIIQPAP
jgi:hypothetical protein